MAAMELTTLICGEIAGTLRQDKQGLCSFTYAPTYCGAPLSLTMPLSNRTYGHNIVRPFLFGLLPDSQEQRRAIAAEYDVASNNPVALLRHIGLDCAGAVQFCQTDQLDAIRGRVSEYRPLSNSQIAHKLKAIRDDESETWMGSNESWSLGGNQGKFALAWHGGQWCECLGSSPTTHIFKNGVVGFKHQALNEFVCMKTAQRVGIPTANVSYCIFEDEVALVVERYDRAVNASGSIERLHQEDFCQTLGVLPSQKYTADGGPTTRDIQERLISTVPHHMNLVLFTYMVFYNAIIGAPDAHAKNYSLILGKGTNAALAPMYDVASGLAYERMCHRARLAMSVGGENRVGRIGPNAIRRYHGMGDPALEAALVDAGLTEKFCFATMMDLAYEVPICMEEVMDEYADLPGMTDLREHMLGPVRENCQRTLDLIRAEMD